MSYRSKLKPISGMPYVESNMADVIGLFQNDMHKVIAYMDKWSWTLHNDLPYAKYLESGFKHIGNGRFYPSVRMLQKIETMIGADAMPFDGRENLKLARLHDELTRYFHTVLSALRAKNSTITPIRSGLLAGGKTGVFNYAQADRRYRDGDYEGWQLTAT